MKVKRSQTTKQRWATYLRVSDEDRQSPERSFAMQRTSIEEQLITPSELPTFREYKDVLTGTSPNRADYQRLIVDAEAGRLSHLGMYRADRFGRNTVEGLTTAERLIKAGVKIRVASMPSMQPETPDGWLMFLFQMGMAQREVDVLRQRTHDGVRAKLESGAWAFSAPEGYVNKERQINSNKYERWVEAEPHQWKVLREAWDMLLTDRYTLDAICEELNAHGYTRQSGSPWAWDDSKRNIRMTAKPRLHAIFHNPFYAGWIVSKAFDIKFGKIRGNWKSIISTREFELGRQILARRAECRSRPKKRFYLLRRLVWVEVDGRRFRLFGSTPRGNGGFTPYYITHAKPRGSKMRFRQKDIDEQIPALVSHVAVDPDHIPGIQEVYKKEIQAHAGRDHTGDLDELKAHLKRLKDQEASMVRMHLEGRVSQRAYDDLRLEWQEKVNHLERRISDLQQDITTYFDDLELALALLARLEDLFPRLIQDKQHELLQVLFEKIVINDEGGLLDTKLNAPFAYISELARQGVVNLSKKKGSAPADTEEFYKRLRVEHTKNISQFLGST